MNTSMERADFVKSDAMAGLKDVIKIAATSAEHSEILGRYRKTATVRLENGQVSLTQFDDTEAHALRVSSEGRVGISSCDSLENTEKLAENAMNSAKLGPEWSFVPPCGEFPEVNIFDAYTADLSPKQLIEMAMELYNEFNPGNIPVNCEVKRSVETICIVNSEGLEGSYDLTSLSLAISTKMEGSSYGPAWSKSRCSIFKPAREELEELKKRYELTGVQKRMKTGRMPVLFAPDSLWALTYRFVLAASGTALENGVSPLAGKENQRILDEKLTLTDDALVDGLTGSSPFDHEGVPHRKVKIFDNGIFREFMMDLRTAKTTGKTSSGNGGRRNLFEESIGMAPVPWPTQLIWQSGQENFDALLKKMDNGLVVVAPMGFHQGNAMQGEYSLNVGLGYVVENGEMTSRAVDCTVSGNVYSDLKEVVGVTKESSDDWWGQGVGVLLPSASVTGA